MNLSVRRVARWAAAPAVAASIILGSAPWAAALDCTNNSKPVPLTAPTPVMTLDEGPDGMVTIWLQTGNWVLISFAAPGGTPSYDDVFWTFIPPGTIPIAPGANGHYQAGQGFALLDQFLQGHGHMCLTPNRQGVTPSGGIKALHGVSAGFCTGEEG